MAGENRKEQSFLQKLKHNYRLVIMNHETFEEVGSYKLSLLNVYVTICVSVVLLTIIVGALIVFTPLRTYVPGYGDASKQIELIRLNGALDDLQKQVSAQQLYNDNIRRILVGEEIQTAEEGTQDAMTPMDSIIEVDPIIEDEMLRKEVALDEQILERELLSKSANYVSKEVPLEQMFFVPPMTGLISSRFDRQKKHYGTDVIAPKNTPVKSIMDGFVFVSDWTLETGNTIGIQHANNLISFYKHNSALLKQVGSFVKAGEAIAIIGNTGELSDGPHLHFEIWHKGKPIDAAEYIIFE
ncbi:MAG: murein DD-endopeptidase MepM/ murein hydrolase activator NlpD [Saprospiraceae bacterium]|jgi:murein DD-endopeptidase MepM/ murein hydrolase activator NlpD